MKFKEYLEQNCINQSAFSKKHKIPIQTISRVIAGGAITLHTAARIVEATGADVDYHDLFTLEEWKEVEDRRRIRKELTKQSQDLRMGY